MSTRLVLAFLAASALCVAVALPSSAASGRSAAAVTVHVYFPRGAAGPGCDRVAAVHRAARAPAVLAGALRALLAGPTAAERARGYGGWFSSRTAGTLRSVRVEAGVAFVDLANLSLRIPNASSSCGGRLLLAQLDRTARQFPSVRATVYSFAGSRRGFYEWLQLAPP